VAAKVHRAAGGHARLCALFGQRLAGVLAADKQNLVAAAHVARVADELAEEQIAAYTAIWASLPAKAKLVLSLVADVDDGATRERLVEIAQERQAPILEEELRRLVADQVKSGRLIDVDAKDGRVGFVADLLRAWVRKHHPFSVAVAESRDYVGPYQILNPVGEGGMGMVYKARDMITNHVVALKVMAKNLLGNREAQKRFLREAELGMKLRHPNIVRIIARGEHAGHGYIAMEFVEGRTLRQKIKQGGAIKWREAALTVAAVADALAEVHTMGIVHRDMKSENIMLAGKQETPKLMDFGLAHRADLSQLTRTGKLMGTMAYVAPEQVAGEDASPSWDIYALGAVLYEALCGDVPFSGLSTVALFKAIAQTAPKRPSERGADVPKEIEDIVLKLLAKSAADRYASAADVAQALRDALLMAKAGGGAAG
jgi:serine/threonine protein kinase